MYSNFVHYAGKSMIIQKYINLYYNKTLQKCVADAIQISQLFLGKCSKARSCLLATALHIISIGLFNIVRKKDVSIILLENSRYYYQTNQ